MTREPDAAVDPVAEMIAGRIAERFAPERIVLFGSRARGDAGEDSDVDLLVVMPDGTDEVAAAVEMHVSLGDLTVAKDIIVTTPDEIARRGHLAGTVLRAALREGRIIMSGPEAVAEALPWLRYAKRDLDLADRMMSDDDPDAGYACWFSQQAAEKALKAALVLEGLDVPFTHDLGAIQGRLPADWPDGPDQEVLGQLTLWGSASRYPGGRDEPTPSDAATASASAHEVYEYVMSEFRRRGAMDGPEHRDD